MITLYTRGTQVITGGTIQLKAQFSNSVGIPADLADFPRVQIVQPNTSLYRDYSSAGVYKLDTGLYALNFEVPINAMIGVYTDNWLGIDGYGNTTRGSFNFIVANTDLAAPNIDGYVHLGDIPELDLSQNALININRLMQILRMRLQSSGVRPTTDGYGNTVYENCNIFTIDEMFAFLCSSLSEFNNTPHFSEFTFEDDIVVDFRDVIVEGAYIMALASKALIEKGREFTISDNGLSYQPPAVADLLNSQMSTLLSAYREKLHYIKANFKPNPLGLGSLRITAVSPLLLRLRHRRAGQFLI
jgi:hypothetical protein